MFHLLCGWLEDDARAAKRARLLVDDSEDDNDLEDNDQTALKAESTFEDLCGGVSFGREESAGSESGTGGWGSLDGHVLARVFHFMRADMKSLAFASVTCKRWRAAVGFYRDISRQIDFSCFGPDCSDSIILNIVVRFSFLLTRGQQKLLLVCKLTLIFSACRVVIEEIRSILWF